MLFLVQNRDEESLTTGDQIYILSDGRKIHHQSRMFIVPRIYYKANRTIFDFFNLEYLEADGHFILRIIGTNARYKIYKYILNLKFNLSSCLVIL